MLHADRRAGEHTLAVQPERVEEGLVLHHLLARVPPVLHEGGAPSEEKVVGGVHHAAPAALRLQRGEARRHRRAAAGHAEGEVEAVRVAAFQVVVAAARERRAWVAHQRVVQRGEVGGLGKDHVVVEQEHKLCGSAPYDRVAAEAQAAARLGADERHVVRARSCPVRLAAVVGHDDLCRRVPPPDGAEEPVELLSPRAVVLDADGQVRLGEESE